MEDEIDLRPYVLGLLQRWWWLVGAAVLLAALGYAGSFLLKPSYDATALVVVSGAEELIQFDPRFEPTSETQPVRAYPTLARSDALLTLLQGRIEARNGTAPRLEQLRRMVSATSADDPRLIILRVTTRTPEGAAATANEWAELFVAAANDLFIGRNDASATYYAAQLDSSLTTLTVADDALTAFQARNRLPVIEAELQSLLASQTSYWQQLRVSEMLLDDITALRAQIDGQSAAAVSLADQLTALSLQIKAFDAQLGLPLQLTTEPGFDLTSANRADQLDALDQLTTTLATRAATATARLADIEPRLLALQAEKSVLSDELDALTREYDLANETVVALARKVREEEIASQNTTSGFKIASQAGIPTRPSGPQRMVFAAGGAVGGLLLATVAAVAVVWREESADQPSNRPATSPRPVT